MESNLLIFSFVVFFWCYIQEILTNPMSGCFSSIFFLEFYSFSSLTLRFLMIFFLTVFLLLLLTSGFLEVLSVPFPLKSLTIFFLALFFFSFRWMDRFFFDWFQSYTFNFALLFSRHTSAYFFWPLYKLVSAVFAPKQDKNLNILVSLLWSLTLFILISSIISVIENLM